MNTHSRGPNIQCYQDLYSGFSNQDQTVQEQHERKKKSRGNRKLQRYRQTFRKQGMDSHTIGELMSSWVDMGQSKTNEVTQQNEQTINPIANETIFHLSKSIKKKKTNNINKKQIIIKKKKNNSGQSMSGRNIKALPVINDSVDYVSIPDQIFSQISSTAFNEPTKLNLFLNEDERIKFIRRYTSLIDRLSCVQLQEFQWKHYHHIGMTQNIWKGRMSKYLGKKYSVCYTYGRSKNLIQQRLNQIEQHLQQAHNTIEQFEQDILSKCAHDNDCCSTIKKLFTIIYRFVQEKQRPLQQESEYKREMLILDATDHQLVQKFFDIEPNKTHIISARRIWEKTMQQMIIEEDIALLEHRLTSTQPHAASNLVHQMVDDINAIINKSNEIAETSPTTCSSSNEINRLQALKKDIIHQAILTSRRMAENFNKIIQSEQNKFSVKNRFVESTSEWQKMALDAIEIRRLHMIERANFIIKHKLVT